MKASDYKAYKKYYSFLPCVEEVGEKYTKLFFGVSRIRVLKASHFYINYFFFIFIKLDKFM